MDNESKYCEPQKVIVRMEDVPVRTFKRITVSLLPGASLYDLYIAIRSAPGSGYKTDSVINLVFEQSH